MIIVLINETVKKYLLKQSALLKKKTREKFEFLETGLWEGGLKVKKLQGTSSKCVFEARLDKANRILFTLGHHYPSPSETIMIIYVWGIVCHDDISKKSNTIIPLNVPFLQFHDFKEITLENVEMEHLEPAYFTQENITQKVSDESGCQKWYNLEDKEWQRIQSYSQDDLEMFLHLTPEQEQILKSPLPLMISGTAGSGKTTLSVYYLLNRNLSQKKKLFITYNTHLKNFAQSLYHGLLIQRPWTNDVLLPEFYTFKELCLQLVGNKSFKPENEVDIERFKSLLYSYSSHLPFDAELIWQEIRATIKGAVPRFNPHVLEKAMKEIKAGKIQLSRTRQLQNQFILFSRLGSFADVAKAVQKYLKIDIQRFAANIEKFLSSDRDTQSILAILDKTLHTLKNQEQKPGQNYLSYLQYELLGKKKAPNFNFNRKEIYHLFEWYQNKLETEHLWDELDLTSMVDTDKYSCDILACDEIQDFTDTQLDVLFNLVRDPNFLFLAGDTKQTINPSGFRWEDVRNHFYDRGLHVPELKTLCLNFRSSGAIIELSNVLLALKEKFIGRKAEEIKEEWKYKGKPVTVVTGLTLKEMRDILAEAGAHRTILVRNEAERELLKKYLDTELIFTITEAKGLEFDTVVLWKFCDDQMSKDVWKVTLEISDKMIHEAKIKHEINLLYVGITRSRRDLIIYDGSQTSFIWENDPIKDYVYVTDDRRFIQGLWNTVSTPAEWIEQGHYFFERNYFQAASECFKNGGDTMNKTRAQAYYFEKIGGFAQAAANFETVNEIPKAAEYYQKAGDFTNALRLWEKLKNKEQTIICRINVLRKKGNYNDAGLLLYKLKNYPAAAECFKAAKNYKEAGDIYKKYLQNNKEALVLYEAGRCWEESAELAVKLKYYLKAAEIYTKLKQFPQAEKYLIKAKNTGKLKQLYEESGQTEKLFTLYEKEKNFDKCVKYLKTLNKDKTLLEQEAETFLKKKKYFQGYVRLYASGTPFSMGRYFYWKGNFQEAINQLEKEGAHYYYIAQCYVQLERYQDAFFSYVQSDEDKQNGFSMARKIISRHYFFNSDQFENNGQDYFIKNDYLRAAFIFSYQHKLVAQEGLCYALMGDKIKAFVYWGSCNTMYELDTIANLSLMKDFIEIPAEYFLSDAGKKIMTHNSLAEMWDCDSLIKLMGIYFKKNPDLSKLRLWNSILVKSAFRYSRTWMVFCSLEKTGEFNAMLRVLKEIKYYQSDNKLPDQADLKKEIPDLVSRREYESAALRYYALDNIHEFNLLLAKMTMNRENYCLFLEGKERYWQRAMDWAIENQLRTETSEFLSAVPETLKSAIFYEKVGDFINAGYWYKLNLQFDKAAMLFEKGQRFMFAGDMHFELKDYSKALEMYKKDPLTDDQRLAKTYEKLNDYKAALSIWKKLGKKKAVERCLKKL